MGEPARVLNEHYTYADYKTWPDDERWEIIEGVAYAMSPSPSWRHQGLIGELFAQLHDFLKGKPCRVFISPLDTLLHAPGEEDASDDAIDTIVQPDVLVVCDKNKLGPRAVRGAPDVAVEVLSPYSWDRDIRLKMRVYEERGVREYWVVDPGNKTVAVYKRETDGRFGKATTIVLADTAEAADFSAALPGFTLDVKGLFAAAETL